MRKLLPEPESAAHQADATELHSRVLHQLGYFSNYVAVVGSVLNATLHGIEPTISRYELAQFICAQQARAELAAVGQLVECCGKLELLDALSEVESRFAACIALAEEEVTGESRSPSGSVIAAQAWQKLAIGLNALDANLIAALDDTGQPDTDPAGRPYRDLLRGVAAGTWPCIDLDGDIRVPDGSLLRKVIRQPVGEVDVEVCSDGRWQSAQIVDHCEGGFGLIGSSDALKPGSPIFIQFAATLGVMCMVRWTRGHRFGVSVNPALQQTLLAKLGLAAGVLNKT